MGAEEDIKNRKQRAGKQWFKVKMQLKNTTLSKRGQARICKACVESALFRRSNTYLVHETFEEAAAVG